MTLQKTKHTDKKFIIVLCTVPCNKDTAYSIAKTLIKRNLAACVTLSNVNSVFFWNKQIEQKQEIQLLIKTHVKLEQKIFKYIKDEHPYQTPEILTLEISNGELHYLSWINDTIDMIKQ